MAEKRQIITRNEQGEVSPPHRAARIAGGTRFDGEVERPTAARTAKLESRQNPHRGLNVPEQFKRAARSKKRVILDV